MDATTTFDSGRDAARAAHAPAPPSRRAPAGTLSGAVTWYHPDKGFGFITADDGSGDVFVRHGDIRMDGFRSLRPGQRVRFRPDRDDHGAVARDVQVL